MTHRNNDFLFRQTINIPFIKLIGKNKKLCMKKDLSSNFISGGVGLEYQFFVKDMGLGFPTNLLISGKSSSKIFLAEIDETVLESVFSSETIYFSFLEILKL